MGPAYQIAHHFSGVGLTESYQPLLVDLALAEDMDEFVQGIDLFFGSAFGPAREGEGSSFGGGILPAFAPAFAFTGPH